MPTAKEIYNSACTNIIAGGTDPAFEDKLIAALAEEGFDIDEDRGYGKTQLFYLAANGRSEEVRILLTHGADANKALSIHSSALHYTLRAACICLTDGYLESANNLIRTALVLLPFTSETIRAERDRGGHGHTVEDLIKAIQTAKNLPATGSESFNAATLFPVVAPAAVSEPAAAFFEVTAGGPRPSLPSEKDRSY